MVWDAWQALADVDLEDLCSIAGERQKQQRRCVEERGGAPQDHSSRRGNKSHDCKIKGSQRIDPAAAFPQALKDYTLVRGTIL